MRVSLKRGSELLLSAALLLSVALILPAALPVRAYAAQVIDLPIDTPAEAHEAVLATGAPLNGFTQLSSEMIGASQYYEVKWEPGGTSIWVVIYTYGWGDCQAGCISRHTFIYKVHPTTGEVTFDRQEGEALPSDAPDALKSFEALGGERGGSVPIATTEPAPSDQPVIDDTDGGALYEEWYEDFVAGLEPCAPGADPADPDLVTCVLPDGSVAGPMPLLALDPGLVDGGESHGDDGWINETPKIILALLLAWIAAAALVGWRKSRAQ